MFYLLHFAPPFWEVLDQNEDRDMLDNRSMDYPLLHLEEVIIVDDEHFESIQLKYPQARHEDSRPS